MRTGSPPTRENGGSLRETQNSPEKTNTEEFPSPDMQLPDLQKSQYGEVLWRTLRPRTQNAQIPQRLCSALASRQNIN